VTALVVLLNKPIKPLLATAQALHLYRGAHTAKPIDARYHALQHAMQSIFHQFGIAA
jgi:hypothetical protein